MSKSFFRRRANRICVFIRGVGFVPRACPERDDTPTFLSAPPERVGDDCLISAEGKNRLARLLLSDSGSAYLVDLGSYPRRAVKVSNG